MRRLLPIIASASLALCLAGCTGTDGSSQSNAGSARESSQSSTKSDSGGYSKITRSQAETYAVQALYQELLSLAGSYRSLSPGSCSYSIGTIEFDDLTNDYIVYGRVYYSDKNGGSCKVNGSYSSDWHCYVGQYVGNTTFYMF